MKIQWLNEVHNEFLKFVTYYVTQVGNPHAEKFQKNFASGRAAGGLFRDGRVEI